MKWREKMRKFLEEVESSDEEGKGKEGEEGEGGKGKGEGSDDEMAKMDARVEKLQKLEADEAKR